MLAELHKQFEKIWKISKKKSFGFGKKIFGSDTDTDTHSFGRNSAPIPNFGRTLLLGFGSWEKNTRYIYKYIVCVCDIETP